MTEQLPIKKGKVTTSEQIHRLGSRLVNRANALDESGVIDATNEYHDYPEGGYVATNEISTSRSGLTLEKLNPRTNYIDRTIVAPGGGNGAFVEAHVPAIQGPSDRVVIHDSGNFYHTGQGVVRSDEMSEKATRRVAAQTLNNVRKELNRRAASADELASSSK